MARPRKVPPPDPFTDLTKKTEILEREMAAQRTAMERLKQIARVRPQPLRAREGPDTSAVKRGAPR